MTRTATGQRAPWWRVVPGVPSIIEGVRASPAADIRAALTVWAVVVPQSLAYATLAGMPSVHGLYAAVGALAAYALFGTCRDLNMGAESTVAIMTAATVAPFAVAADEVIELTAVVALLVGGWCVLGFVFRLGFIADFLSRPILAGYVFGSGIIIVVSQLEGLLGLEIESDIYVTDVGAVVRNLDDVHLLSAVLGTSTIVLVMGLRRFVPKVPAPLVAVVLGILVVTIFDLDQEGVAVVGTIESGVPTPSLPSVGVDQLAQLLLPALGIALLAYPDSFLTARSLASRSDYDLDADQEFLAIGASNLAAGALQGFPVNGSQSRSFVQADAGARTNLAGLLCAGLVVMTLLFLTGLFEKLPDPVLAGIVIVAGLGLFALDDFRSLWSLRRSEFWLGAITVISVLALGMLGGIAAAIGLSLVVTLSKAVRPHTAELGRVEGTDTFRDLDNFPTASRVPGLLIHRVDSELFFANASYVANDIRERLADSDPPVRTVVLDLEGVADIDTTAISVLEDLVDELEADGVEVWAARVRQPVREMIRRSRLDGRVRPEHVFLEVDDAAREFERRQEANGSDES